MLSMHRPRSILALIATPLLLYVGLQWYMLNNLLLSSSPAHPSRLKPLSAPPAHQESAGDQIHRHEKTCPERRNLVFLKGMKCATNTLIGMLTLFAFKRNLSVALPMDKLIYHNWPYPMTKRDVRPTHRREYNMIFHHAIYTPSVMQALMPPNTVYISIIRQPFSHLQSVFRYFNVAEIAGLSGLEPDNLVEYFSDVERHEEAYKSPRAQRRWCIPDGFSVTRNLQSHCHGMPLGFPAGTQDISGNTVAVDEYIRELSRSFKLVMIVEHLYESVILLRRLMCWEFKDIVFVSNNIAHAPKGGRVKQNDPHIMEFHKRWSHVDYRLYDYFNKTLWKHISTHGSGFYREVKAFKAVQRRVERYCLDVYSRVNENEPLPTHTEASSEWSRKFSISAEDCRILGPNPYKILHKMQNTSNTLDKDLLHEAAKIADVRQHKSLC
ncbi:hypothetical protein EGW08_020893 [Elysia chlorotica]|uniref:Sulfotransferase domain-containing protein n=1 Tax=Elysia chlorotica TaxID=188477 RepID=A0A3S0ZBT2_ELYCH|nr:hypothetical protein EGW08_020893 [Elysia chlorotica]